ncbi:hypothetical protein DENSPDRAFT_865485 [Dentipellis sp. KUC8613]|nr:hypothetical protein DENSPDRAFT_865485 [Dentipellis sp. KUC8613]
MPAPKSTSTPAEDNRLLSRDIPEVLKGGGGGHARGGGGGGKSGNGGGKSAGHPAGSPGAHVSMPGLPGGKSATAYGDGGGPVIIVPAGQPFGGSAVGGGTRKQVIDPSSYLGCNATQLNHDLPFYFWPVVWRDVTGHITVGCLNESQDARGPFGTPENPSRPGGPLAQASFESRVDGSMSTLHVLADESTLSSLLSSISLNCSSAGLVNGTTHPYNGSSPSDPEQKEAIQYYRATSVVLTDDGYNKSSTAFLRCLNDTIANGVPLVSSATVATPELLVLHMGTLVIGWFFLQKIL